MTFASLPLAEVLLFCLFQIGHGLFNVPANIDNYAFHPVFRRAKLVYRNPKLFDYHGVYGHIKATDLIAKCGDKLGVDRYGFTHNGDPERKINEESFKVFILGGSTIAGFGDSCENATIPAQLEKMIAEKYSNVQVINAGVSDYYSATELMRLIHEVSFYQPNIVISFSGTNDRIQRPASYQGRPHAYFASTSHQKFTDLIEKRKSVWFSVRLLATNLISLHESLYSWFVLESLARAIAPSWFAPSSVPTTPPVMATSGPNKVKQHASTYFHYIQMTRSVVRGLNAKYLFVLQPILATESRQLSATEQKTFRSIASTNMPPFTQALWQLTDNKLASSDVPYENFTNIFLDSHGEIYVDHVHYNDKGNRIIAKKLYEALEKRNYLPASLRRN